MLNLPYIDHQFSLYFERISYFAMNKEYTF